MFTHREINNLLNQLQEETPNTGGFYHFSRIDLPEGENLTERLRAYHAAIEKYADPYYYEEQSDRMIYVEGRDPKNLVLMPVDDHVTCLDEKLLFWSEHRTSLDGRENITVAYAGLEIQFKTALLDYLQNEGLKATYTLGGIDTLYSFGQDHVNDDIIFETEKGVYVLHFGWSS